MGDMVASMRKLLFVLNAVVGPGDHGIGPRTCHRA